MNGDDPQIAWWQGWYDKDLNSTSFYIGQTNEEGPWWGRRAWDDGDGFKLL